MKHRYIYKHGRTPVCKHCGCKRRSRGRRWLYLAPGGAWSAANPPCRERGADLLEMSKVSPPVTVLATSNLPPDARLSDEERADIHTIRRDIEARIQESIDSNGMEMCPSQIAEWTRQCGVLRKIAPYSDEDGP